MEDKKRELLFSLTRKDFKVEAFCSGGHGGQRANRKHTACRITHEPSGASAVAQDERSYPQNEQLAFRRLIESSKFKAWHSMEVSRRMGIFKDLDKKVDEEMKKIKVEIKKDGRWVEGTPTDD